MTDTYTVEEVVLGRRTDKPKKGYRIVSKSPDGWKTRAQRLCEALNAYYSHRMGYVLSARKFARFEQLWREGYDANFISNTLIPPSQ